MSETISEEITPEEARRILQSIFDYCEGKASIEQEELKGLGGLLVVQWLVLFPVLVEMCGSEENAKIQIRQMKELFKMGTAPTNTRQ